MLPTHDFISKILDLKNEEQPLSTSSAMGILNSVLMGPIEEFLSRPKKSMRRKIMQLGQGMAKDFLLNKNLLDWEPDNDILELFDNVVELLHSGSLIIDDIEDQSAYRRGKKTLHELHGTPIALNAGNWLYFWPLVLIQNSKLSDSLKTEALKECQFTLLKAHMGQALDIGTKLEDLSPQNVSDVILKSIELKSGALAELSIKLGALTIFSSFLNNNNFKTQWLEFYKAIGEFGNRLGQLLQYYDDIGNLSSKQNPEKRFEDLKLLRPSFVWVALSQKLNPDEYSALLKTISITKDPIELNCLTEKFNIYNTSFQRAENYKTEWILELKNKVPYLSSSAFESIHKIIERLIHAY